MCRSYVKLRRVSFFLLAVACGTVTPPVHVEAQRWFTVDPTLADSSRRVDVEPLRIQQGKGKGLFKKDRTTEPAPEENIDSTHSSTSSTSSTTLTFTAMEGGSNPPHQTLTLTNLEGGTLSWSASENAAWLNLSPASGTTANQTDTITVTVDTAGLSSNTYTATITVAVQSPPRRHTRSL